MTKQNTASGAAFQIAVQGNEIDANYLVSWSIQQDFGQPDMCVISLRNEDHIFSDKFHPINMGQPASEVTVLVGADKYTIFEGEVVAMEPTYQASGQNTLVLRAFGYMHRLTHGRKSVTFTGASDAVILRTIAGANGLSWHCGAAGETTHTHVYQRNQTDLQFLRKRAERLGYDLWVRQQTLYMDQPRSDGDLKIELCHGDASPSSRNSAVSLKRFTPKLSTAGVLSEVAQPIYAQEKADKIAADKLRAANMRYITGDGECRGTPGIRPGVVVTVTVNPDKREDRFNGKYLIVSSVHRYANKNSGDPDGYITRFRVQRDAEGGP